MTDTIPEFIDDDIDDPDEPPVQFKVTYVRGGEKTSEEFAAIPRVQFPYAWLLDYFAAGVQDWSAQSAATLRFLDRVLLATDGPEGGLDGSSRARFTELIHDPAVAIKGSTLRDVQIYLISQYETPDPTRARSAGPKRSRTGRSRTGSGSTARASARGSTSR